MTTRLSTHGVAAFIHDAVWQRNDALPDELLATSSLRRAFGHATETEQVRCRGSGGPTEPAYETLTKGRSGLYYFQVTEGIDYVGGLTLGRHVIAPSSDEKIARRFAQSLIVKEFMHLTEGLD